MVVVHSIGKPPRSQFIEYPWISYIQTFSERSDFALSYSFTFHSELANSGPVPIGWHTVLTSHQTPFAKQVVTAWTLFLQWGVLCFFQEGPSVNDKRPDVNCHEHNEMLFAMWKHVEEPKSCLDAVVGLTYRQLTPTKRDGDSLLHVVHFRAPCISLGQETKLINPSLRDHEDRWSHHLSWYILVPLRGRV